MKNEVVTKLNNLPQIIKWSKSEIFRPKKQKATYWKREIDTAFIVYSFFYKTGRTIVLPILLLTVIGYLFGSVSLEVFVSMVIVLNVWVFGAAVTIWHIERGGRK